MDGVLDKVGLYDIFGVFLSGMTMIVTGIILELPPITPNVSNSDITRVISFLVESYLIGLVLREVSSNLDKKLFKFQDRAESTFLNQHNMVIRNTLELSDYKKMANHILKKKSNNTVFSIDEHKYVFNFCRTFLELEGKSGMADTIRALYVMSRNLMVAFPTISIYYCVECFFKVSPLYMLILIALTCIFYKRAEGLSRHKVRAIIRYYSILIQHEENHSP